MSSAPLEQILKGLAQMQSPCDVKQQRPSHQALSPQAAKYFVESTISE